MHVPPYDINLLEKLESEIDKHIGEAVANEWISAREMSEILTWHKYPRNRVENFARIGLTEEALYLCLH